MQIRVTWLFIVLSVAMFLADLSTGRQLMLWGAKSSALWAGEWHRLLSATFLHGDFTHLLFNMYALFIFGGLVERVAGQVRFAIVYLLSGVIGYLASLLAQPYVPAVGASAAVFGLMGYMLHYRLRQLPRRILPIDTAFLQIIAINVLMGLVVPNIDQWAHLGGIVGGFLAASVVGMPVAIGKSGPTWMEKAAVISVLFVLLSLVVSPAYTAKVLMPLWPAAARSIDNRYGQYGAPLWAQGITLVWKYVDAEDWQQAPDVLYPRADRPMQLAVFWRWERGQARAGQVPYRVTWHNANAVTTPVRTDVGIGLRPDADKELVYMRSGVTADVGLWTVKIVIDDRDVYRRTVEIKER